MAKAKKPVSRKKHHHHGPAWKRTMVQAGDDAYETHTLKLASPLMLQVIQYSTPGETHLFYGELIKVDENGSESDPILEVSGVEGAEKAKKVLWLMAESLFCRSLEYMGRSYRPIWSPQKYMRGVT